MNKTDQIKEQQKKWAKSKGILLDDDNYVKRINDNFFIPLSESTKKDLMGGDGSEYPRDKKTRTKILATHSSSALLCNFFEYWRSNDKAVLSNVLGYKQNIKSLVFEQKLCMGMKGSKPNLDIFLIMEDGLSVAIESKFTEWMNHKTKSEPFAKSYFKDDIKRWEEVGLPKYQKLAEDIKIGTSYNFKHLNAPQLLKHALGLARMHSNRSHLLYLYFNIKGTAISEAHCDDINEFKKALNGKLNFREITYQQLFKSLETNRKDIDEEYLEYLQTRYFFNV